MSFVWYTDPNYEAPYRSDNVKESCELAYEYFSMILDDFIARLPEYRQSLEFVDWLAEEPTLADRVHLIFPNGFGVDDEKKNHNPRLWPVLIEMSNAMRDGTTEAFANDLCESWEKLFNANGQYKDQIQLLQRSFDFLTYYLQLFVILTDTDSLNQDFIYPPEDECGVLMGSVFRKT